MLPLNKIYNLDCMLGMAEFPDNYFELSIVDPPYELPERSGRGAGKLQNRVIQKMHQKGWDKAPPPEYFTELFRVSKNQIIWGGNYFLDYLKSSRGIICWDKKQPWPNFSSWEMAWTSFDCVARTYRYDNRQDKKQHPTQKPVKLYKWLLHNYAKQGDKILDTHTGSASSIIACEWMGFEYVGFELDKDYYEASLKRLDRERQKMQQMKMEL